MFKELNNKKVVFCLSNDSYDAKIWTNKQHLMSRLADKEGYYVIYVDQGLSSRYIKELWSSGRILHFFKFLRKRKPGLSTLSLPLPLIRGGVFKKLSWFFLAKFCNFYFRQCNIFYWIYQPQAYYFVRHIKSERVLYDCVDEFKSQPFYSNYPKRRKELEKIEVTLTKIVNFVSTTSLALYEDKKVLNPKVAYIHNVGDFDHFSSLENSTIIEEKWLHDPRVKVMFTGVIDDYKTDLSLVKEIAMATKDTHVYIFVGPVRVRDAFAINELKGLNNIFFLGYKDYFTIPSYCHRADILWVPYFKSSHTERVFPIKIFEYLATGKPVIAKDLSSLDEYSECLCLFSDSVDLKEKIKKVLEEDTLEKRDHRMKLASQNTWVSRLNRIMKFVDL